VGQRRRDYSGIILQVNLIAAKAGVLQQAQISEIGWS
jgi:hypothetical protein